MNRFRYAIAGALVSTFLPMQAAAYIFYNCKKITSVTVPAIVADINPGPADAANIFLGFSHRHRHMINFDGALYFQADNGTEGSELWRVSDGAPSIVQNLAPDGKSSSPHAFAELDGKLYFAATTPATGEELYVYDGAMISLAAQTSPGPDGGEIRGLTTYNGELYFARYSPQDGHQVWRFDGSVAAPVQAINQAPIFWVQWSPIVANLFAPFNGKLYFVARTASYQYELWSYDGSTAQKFKALTVGNDSWKSYGFDLGVYDDALYFGRVASASSSGLDELWRYTGQGWPEKVTTFNSAYSFYQAGDFEVYGTELYFKKAYELYRVDGGGVQNLSVALNTIPHSPSRFTGFTTADASRLFFTGFSNDWTDREPFVFNGATANLLDDIKPNNSPGFPGSFPTRGVQSHDRLFFYADDDVHGRELWSFGAGPPYIDCDIVAAPIWDDWTVWPIDRRTVVVETHLAPPEGRPRRVFQGELVVRRGAEARVEILPFDERREKAPDAYGLFTVIRDKETGVVLDWGFEVIGVPTERARAAIERSAASLEKSLLRTPGVREKKSQ